MVLLAGVAVAVPLIDRPSSSSGIGSLDGERWRATLGTEPSFRFTNTDVGLASPVSVAVAAEDVHVVSAGAVAAHGAARGDRRWQRILPAPRSPSLVGRVLVVATDRGVVALDRETGEIRWEHPAPRSVRTATGDGLVFLADTTGLTALDASDGRPVWSLPTVRTSGADSLVVLDGLLAVAAHDEGTVRGIDAGEGSVRWERSFRRPLSVPPVAGDGNVYVRTGPDAVIALDARTGQERWRAPSPPGVGALIPADGVVVRWTRNGGTVGLAARDGRPLWSRPAGTSAPPIVGDGTVYLPRTSPGRIEALDATTATTRWSRPRPPAHLLAAAHGRLYLAERETIVAWDAGDGTERWRVSPAEPDRPPGYPTPVVAGDRVYVTTVGGPLVALDRASGAERWRLDPRDVEDELPTERPSGTTSVAFPLGDRLVVASNRAVYAVDARSGDVLASFPTNVAPGAVPVLAGGHVIINLGPSLVGLDPDTLALRWQYTTPTQGARIGAHRVTAPTVHRDVVVVGGGAGTLAALDPATGDPVWDLDLGTAIVSRPAVGDEAIVVRTETGDVRAFDADNGRARWRQALSSTGLSDPVVGDGTVYATDGGELIALELRTGMERWRTDLDSGDLSPPAVFGDVTYVGSTQGEVIAVGDHAGEVRWRFPTGGTVDAPPAVTGEELVTVTADGAVVSLH